MQGVQEQGWGQLDPTLCIRLLYSPGVSLEWNYVLDFPPKLVPPHCVNQQGVWFVKVAHKNKKWTSVCCKQQLVVQIWSSSDHRFLTPGTAAGDDSVPCPVAVRASWWYPIRALLCAHMELCPHLKLCWRWAQKFRLSCEVDFSHEGSSYSASLPPLPEGTGTASLLGAGSVFSPTVVSQGMKLSEKNQGSPAGDLWILV